MTAGGAADSPAMPRPVTLWRLEGLRLVRTPQAVMLAAVFVAIGLIEPVLTRYQNDLLSRLGHGQVRAVAAPVAADGLSSYVSQAMLIGLIMVVMVTAAAMSFDARPGVATFLRTRAASMGQLIAPRVTIAAAAAVLAYWLGTIAAWAQTRELIGSLPAGAVAGGALCGAVYLVFAIAVTALSAGIGRGTLAAGAIALGILLALSALGVIGVTSRYLPGALAGAPAALASRSHSLAYYLPAMLIALAAAAAALMFSARQLSRREL